MCTFIRIRIHAQLEPKASDQPLQYFYRIDAAPPLTYTSFTSNYMPCMHAMAMYLVS